MSEFLAYLVERGPYLLFVVLMVVGTYLVMSHRNYLKAIVGLYFVQTAVILFFIIVAFREDGSVPIAVEGQPIPLHNPLPQALMLTAIVVGVATLGVAMAILRRVQAESGTIEERATARPDD